MIGDTVQWAHPGHLHGGSLLIPLLVVGVVFALALVVAAVRDARRSSGRGADRSDDPDA